MVRCLKLMDLIIALKKIFNNLKFTDLDVGLKKTIAAYKKFGY